MPSPPRRATTALADLKTVQIKRLLALIGARRDGKKNDLLTTLRRDVGLSLLPRSQSRHQSGRDGSGEGLRMLSVDMGIRNLAFAVCDVRFPLLQADRRGKAELKADTRNEITVKVVEWKRLAVVASSSDSIGMTTQDTEDAHGTLASATGDPRSLTGDDDPFAPQCLSITASDLVRDIFLPFDADSILIERQRFRSAGASAVLEWTLRVNMLEGMIWSSFRSFFAHLRIVSGNGGHGNGESVEEGVAPRSEPELWAVNPKTVANFFLCHLKTGVGTVRSKIEKKEKIALARRWLEEGRVCWGQEVGMILRFEGEAARTRDAFLARARGKRKGEEGLVKLDDVADCLLQAVAWIRWEENRRQLRAMVGSDDAGQVLEWLRKRMEGDNEELESGAR